LVDVADIADERAVGGSDATAGSAMPAATTAQSAAARVGQRTGSRGVTRIRMSISPFVFDQMFPVRNVSTIAQ
jgi:hypothetical protein